MSSKYRGTYKVWDMSFLMQKFVADMLQFELLDV